MATPTRFLALLVVFVGLLMPRPALAGRLDLERPGQRQFVADHADLLDADAERRIQELAAELLDEHATPIVVVTIESMAAHGGRSMTIDTFAHTLFDQWGVGHPTFQGAQWDTGILLVISKEDRQARIELGSGWAHDKDAQAQRIMQERIVPAFREGDYSTGTVRGVEALAAMARSKPLPEPRRRVPTWLIEWGLIAVGVLLAIAILMSIIKSGTQGWGWKLLALVFTLLGLLLGAMLIDRRRRRRSGYCRPRGSFGGGRSGGGGATGSW